MNAIDLLFDDITKTFQLTSDQINKSIISGDGNLIIINNLTIDPKIFGNVLDMLESVIKSKIYLGSSGYIEFQLLRGGVTKKDNDVYTFVFSYNIVENYKSYLDVLPKEMLLSVILSTDDIEDYNNLMQSLPILLIDEDYLMMSSMLYPKFSKLISEVITNKDISVWKTLFFIFQYGYNRIQKLTSTSDDTDKIIIKQEIRYFLSSGDGILRPILNKLLTKYEYPYMYSQIEHIYTLKDFEKDYLISMDLYHLSPILYQYVKTGKIDQEIGSTIINFNYGITPLYLLFKDGVKVTSLMDLLNILKYICKQFQCGRNAYFTGFIDFLNKLKFDKTLLKSALMEIENAA